MDFGGKSLVACRDLCEEYPVKAKEWKQRLDISDSHVYFNSGVLFQNDALYVDEKQYNISPIYSPDEFLEEYENVKVIHYYGDRKPWKLLNGIDPKFDYWKIQRQRGRLVQCYIVVWTRTLHIEKTIKFCKRAVRK